MCSSGGPEIRCWSLLTRAGTACTDFLCVMIKAAGARLHRSNSWTFSRETRPKCKLLCSPLGRISDSRFVGHPTPLNVFFKKSKSAAIKWPPLSATKTVACCYSMEACVVFISEISSALNRDQFNSSSTWFLTSQSIPWTCRFIHLYSWENPMPGWQETFMVVFRRDSFTTTRAVTRFTRWYKTDTNATSILLLPVTSAKVDLGIRQPLSSKLYTGSLGWVLQTALVI